MYKLCVKSFDEQILKKGSLASLDNYLCTFAYGNCYGNVSSFLDHLKKSKKISQSCDQMYIKSEKKEEIIPAFLGVKEKKILKIALSTKMRQSLDEKQSFEVSDNKPLELDQYMDDELYKWYREMLKVLTQDKENGILNKAFSYGLFEKRLYSAILDYLKYARNKNYSPYYQDEYKERSMRIDRQILRYNVIRSLLTANSELYVPALSEFQTMEKRMKPIFSDSGEYIHFSSENDEYLTAEEYQKSYQ